MFDKLSGKLSEVFDGLRRRGALSEADVSDALREVRLALLEADVALDVVRDFTERVRVKAIGQEVLKSVTPGQMVVKIVNDELVRTLGSDAAPIDLHAAPPVVILMAGLQGSGKTTSTAKIALPPVGRPPAKMRLVMTNVEARTTTSRRRSAIRVETISDGFAEVRWAMRNTRTTSPARAGRSVLAA